jgi:hypothetical protein
MGWIGIPLCRTKPKGPFMSSARARAAQRAMYLEALPKEECGKNMFRENIYQGCRKHQEIVEIFEDISYYHFSAVEYL